MSYFGEAEGQLWENYMKTASHPALENYQFLHTTDAECAKNFSTTAPGIAISRNFDQSPVVFSGSENLKELV